MAKNVKKKRRKFTWRQMVARLAIMVGIVGSLAVVVPIAVSYASPNRVAREGVYDKKGNLINGGWTWANISARWQDGWDTIKGNFTQFGNHYNSSGYGTNYDAAKRMAKSGKLSKEQLYGTRFAPSTLEEQGLYQYAKSIGLDPKAYNSDKSLLNAVEKKLGTKMRATDKAGEENKRMWGSVGKEQENQKKVWEGYTSGLLSAKKNLSSSAAKKVDEYLKKYGGEKGSDKWYKALDTALEKYATGNAKKEYDKTKKDQKKGAAAVGEGAKKTSAEDAMKMLQTGEMPEPSTLWGKIGKALMNAFWASSIGTWLEKNGAGATIFAGTTSADQLASDIQTNPTTLIYPASSTYSTMQQVADWLQPAMIAAGGALITLAVVVASMQMGWGQVIDPVRSRLHWYQTWVDTIIAVVGVAAFPAFVTMILQVNGDILLGFANFMTGLTPAGAKESVFDTALKLGFDKTTINAIASGMLLGGSDFSGVIFEIVYLLAYVGLAVYIKYFYFVRAITFTILIGIGPIFMALWSFNFGKQRTFAWLRDFLGTVFIQSIHALVILFMALFMDWNNGRITNQTAQQIADMLNWQKANPGKQFLNTITLGIANQGPQTASGASVFEVLVVGFIIMILFKPLSKSLAELFGISTNMLDNIHQSTSRTLKAGALVGGAAIGTAAFAPVGLALGGAKGVLGAGKDALKNAGKGAKSFKDFKSNLKNNFRGDFAKSYRKRRPLTSTMAKINGIVGPSTGRLMGFAAGAGAGDPEAMLALSAAGGAIGTRAARLANKPLSALGLGQLKRVKGAFTTDPNTVANYKVNAANKKTSDSLVDGNKAVRDAENGHQAVDPNLANFQQQRENLKKQYEANNIDKPTFDAKTAAIAEQERTYKNLVGDEAVQNRIATADARKQEFGSYSNAADLSKATKEALGSEFSKLTSDDGNADKIQQSLALSGAATKGAVISRLDGNKINQAALDAKNSYAKANAGKWKENGFKTQQAWIDSSQYRQGEANAMSTARTEAAMQSNGKVFSMPDQANNMSFGSSAVNKNVFKDEMKSQMAKAGVNDVTQQKVLNAIDGVGGQALVTQTSIDGADSDLKTINYGLSNKLDKQQAFSINQSANNNGSTPVSAYDLAQVYKGDNNPSTVIGGTSDDVFSADAFNNYMANNKNMQYYQNIQKGLADSYAQYQQDQAHLNNVFDSAAQKSDMLSAGNWLSGGYGGYSRMGNSNFGNGSDGLTPNDYIAARRISDFNTAFGPSGMSPQEAIDELSSHSDGLGEGSGIAAGDLQLVTGNTGSYIRAKMGDGSYQLVGNYGAGDPALNGGESIIQNLDVSPDGTIGPRFDSQTHRIESPYSEIGDIKVDRAYTNGGPDLTQMLGGYASPIKQSSVDMSDYHTMQQASELQRADFDNSEITLDKLGGNYSDYAYYSDGNNGVIVGLDQRDGLYKQLSPEVSEGMLDTHATGQQYMIPLKDTGNGLVPDAFGEPMVYSKDPISSQNKKEILDTLRTHINNPGGRDDFSSYLDGILRQTTQNEHNFKASHPANQSIDSLDLADMK